MQLSDPDEIYATNEGLLLTKLYPRGASFDVDRVLLYQHVTIKAITTPEFFKGIHSKELDLVHRSELNLAKNAIIREKKSVEPLFLKHREKNFIYKPQNGMPLNFDKITKFQLREMLENLRSQNVDLHFHRSPKASDTDVDDYLITGVKRGELSYIEVPAGKYYRNYIGQIIKDIVADPVLAQFKLPDYLYTIHISADMMSFTPKKKDYTNNAIPIPFYIISDFITRNNRVGDHGLRNDRGNDKHPLLLGYMASIPIYLSSRTILSEAYPHQEFYSLLSDHFVIKIGGYQPPDFVSLDDIDLHLDFLEYLENSPIIYSKLLRLIESTFQIREFSQIFKQFIDLYNESLSDEQQDRYNLEYLVRMLKDIPLSSLEIPIDQQTKVKLNQFFLKFGDISRLHSPKGYQLELHLPKHLYIPTTNLSAARDLVFLDLLLYQALDYLVEYDIVIIDNEKFRELLLGDGIRSNFSQLQHLKYIICDEYPWRLKYQSFDILTIQPSAMMIEKIERDYKLRVDNKDWYLIQPNMEVLSLSLPDYAYLPLYYQQTELEMHRSIENDSANQDDWVEDDWEEDDTILNQEPEPPTVKNKVTMDKYQKVDPPLERTSKTDTINDFIDDLVGDDKRKTDTTDNTPETASAHHQTILSLSQHQLQMR